MSYLEIKDLEISFPTPKGKYVAVTDINLIHQKRRNHLYNWSLGLWKIDYYECHCRNANTNRWNSCIRRKKY